MTTLQRDMEVERTKQVTAWRWWVYSKFAGRSYTANGRRNTTRSRDQHTI